MHHLRDKNALVLILLLIPILYAATMAHSPVLGRRMRLPYDEMCPLRRSPTPSARMAGPFGAL